MTHMGGMGLGILADSLGISDRCPSEWVETRETDDETAMRDVGMAAAEVINVRWGHQLRAGGPVDLALDSPYVREGLGYALIAELSRAGYSVTFRGRR